MEVLRLYRAGLRVAKQYTVVPIRDKLRLVGVTIYSLLGYSVYLLLRVIVSMISVPMACRHNIRDFIELHCEETDQHRLQELVSTGKKNLETLRQLSDLDKNAWHRTDY